MSGEFTLFALPPAVPGHPAPYTEALLPVMARYLRGCTRVLDPFGGVGGVFALAHYLPGVRFEAVEIEPEWAEADPRITHGDALALPWPDGTFDGICVSPVYGNRMSDHHGAGDDSRRMTYRHRLGRALHPHNAGRLQWGPKYRAMHLAAWKEARRVLRDGGRFVLNCKDHIRSGQLQEVTGWHVRALGSLGFVEVGRTRVRCPGMRFGSNADLRVEEEWVICMVLRGCESETTERDDSDDDAG